MSASGIQGTVFHFSTAWGGYAIQESPGGYRVMSRKRTGRGGTGEVRIIGGTWRSRRIRFPGELDIRPTPDRLRETLFNWLGEWVIGRRVLDLFAGSGALGIEALSRGAREAVFVE